MGVCLTVTFAVACVAAGGQVADGASSCAGVVVRVSRMEVSEPTGDHTVVLVVSNRGSGVCILRGYPRIALLDNRGRELTFTYRGRDERAARLRPNTVRLPRGGRAFFALDKWRCDGAGTTVATTVFVRVLLPGARHWVRARIPFERQLPYCPSDGEGWVIVSPLTSTYSAALAP